MFKIFTLINKLKLLGVWKYIIGIFGIIITVLTFVERFLKKRQHINNINSTNGRKQNINEPDSNGMKQLFAVEANKHDKETAPENTIPDTKIEISSNGKLSPDNKEEAEKTKNLLDKLSKYM